VIVVSMITEHEDCDPIDQGPQAICLDATAVEQWVKQEWPFARYHDGSDTWEIFDDQGNSLEAFLVSREMDVFTGVEKIDRAAVNYPDIGVLSVPQPGRHHHVMWLRLLLDGQATPGHAEQGFTTTSGRFVGREEGLEIATANNQIKEKRGNPGLLFSEDMWDTPAEARPYRIVSTEDADD
jgi:hypothetical protein